MDLSIENINRLIEMLGSTTETAAILVALYLILDVLSPLITSGGVILVIYTTWKMFLGGVKAVETYENRQGREDS